MPLFYPITLFEHTKNSQGTRASVSWENFTNSMRSFAAQKQTRKTACQQISGNTFKDNIRRKVNAEFVNIAFIDVDNKDIEEDQRLSMESAMQLLQGIMSLLVTSWSHKQEDPRFRVMLPLAEPVPAKKFRPVMYDIFQRLFKGSEGVDPASYKNVALPYYLPSNNAGVLEVRGDLWFPREMEPPAKKVDMGEVSYIGMAGMSAYLQAVVKNNQNDIRSAGTAGRNNALNRAAYSMGRIVGAGLLTIQEVTEILKNEAIACGLMSEDGKQSIMATMESGLKSGIQRPANVRKLNTDNIFKRGK